MDPSTQAALRRINRAFYSRQAADFDRTRHPGGWPGWRRVVELAARLTNGSLRVLDLGCGNGRFALFLERDPALRSHQPFDYLGIDLSPELIERAKASTAGLGHIRLEIGDMEGGMQNDPPAERGFDLVTLFGVLHHLPGLDARRSALARAASVVAPGGLLALACWQFADDPRFEHRRLDWASQAGIDQAELEPGDHLLRWGPTDSSARRYCHHTDEPELDRLVAGLPLAEVARYRADGSGNRQNLYWLATRENCRSAVSTASRGRRSSGAGTPR